MAAAAAETVSRGLPGAAVQQSAALLMIYITMTGCIYILDFPIIDSGLTRAKAS